MRPLIIILATVLLVLTGTGDQAFAIPLESLQITITYNNFAPSPGVLHESSISGDFLLSQEAQGGSVTSAPAHFNLLAAAGVSSATSTVTAIGPFAVGSALTLSMQHGIIEDFEMLWPVFAFPAGTALPALSPLTVPSFLVVGDLQPGFDISGPLYGFTGQLSLPPAGQVGGPVDFGSWELKVPADVAAVPEPGSFLMICVGMGVLGLVIRARGSRSCAG